MKGSSVFSSEAWSSTANMEETLTVNLTVDAIILFI